MRVRSFRWVLAAVVATVGAVTACAPPPGPSTSILVYATEDPFTGEWRGYFATCSTVDGTIRVGTDGGTPGARLDVVITDAGSSTILGSGSLEAFDDVVTALMPTPLCFTVEVTREPPPAPFAFRVSWG